MGLFGFNPRARVGRDPERGKRLFVKLVSIHAPAWGATAGHMPVILIGAVSIHAPAWGATGQTDKKAGSHLFQSTRPRGARHRQL